MLVPATSKIKTSAIPSQFSSVLIKMSCNIFDALISWISKNFSDYESIPMDPSHQICVNVPLLSKNGLCHNPWHSMSAHYLSRISGLLVPSSSIGILCYCASCPSRTLMSLIPSRAAFIYQSKVTFFSIPADSSNAWRDPSLSIFESGMSDQIVRA